MQLLCSLWVVWCAEEPMPGPYWLVCQPKASMSFGVEVHVMWMVTSQIQTSLDDIDFLISFQPGFWPSWVHLFTLMDAWQSWSLLHNRHGQTIHLYWFWWLSIPSATIFFRVIILEGELCTHSTASVLFNWQTWWWGHSKWWIFFHSQIPQHFCLSHGLGFYHFLYSVPRKRLGICSVLIRKFLMVCWFLHKNFFLCLGVCWIC